MLVQVQAADMFIFPQIYFSNEELTFSWIAYCEI